MATPTLLNRIDQPGDIGNAAGSSIMEVPCGGISGPFTVFVPTGGIVVGPEIFYTLGMCGFGMQIDIPAIGQVELDMVPVHPITLAEFSDVVNGQFAIPILPAIGTAQKYLSFGNSTNEDQMGLASMAFKLRFIDNVGGATGYNVTYTLFGFSFLSRRGE